jgi:ABC-type nitrate/sulfonate/bicarbonate transport system substrate-binding protein
MSKAEMYGMNASAESDRPLRLGFVQLWDAAPILVAGAEGYFAKLGLAVEITRELGWTTIREKLIHSELDFAHALGVTPMAVTHGLDGPAEELVGLGVLSRNGNGITVARHYWDKGIRSGSELAEHIHRERWRQRFVFAVVSKISSHHILMLDWLESLGLSSKSEVEIVQLPPGQFIRNLDAGTIDAACIGEPWNSLAVLQRSGWVAADSTDLSPGHPEKTLMATRRTVEERSDLTARVFAAVLAGAERCADPDYKAHMLSILAQRGALRITAAQLKQCSQKSLWGSEGTEPLAGLHFSGENFPLWSAEDYEWMVKGVSKIGMPKLSRSMNPRSLSRIYPNQLFKSAQPYIAELRALSAV